MQIKLSIIIVSWNVKDLLEQCLTSIQTKVSQSLSYEIIVIDNASVDGTNDMVRLSFPYVNLVKNQAISRAQRANKNEAHNGSEQFSSQKSGKIFNGVKLIANTVNRGFAAACNQGAQAAQGEYMAFLNPDTDVKEQTFENLVAFLDAHPDTAAVGPRLAGADGAIQPSVRGFPTPLSCFLVFLKLE